MNELYIRNNDAEFLDKKPVFFFLYINGDIYFSKHMLSEEHILITIWKCLKLSRLSLDSFPSLRRRKCCWVLIYSVWDLYFNSLLVFFFNFNFLVAVRLFMFCPRLSYEDRWQVLLIFVCFFSPYSCSFFPFVLYICGYI